MSRSRGTATFWDPCLTQNCAPSARAAKDGPSPGKRGRQVLRAAVQSHTALNRTAGSPESAGGRARTHAAPCGEPASQRGRPQATRAASGRRSRARSAPWTARCCAPRAPMARTTAAPPRSRCASPRSARCTWRTSATRAPCSPGARPRRLNPNHNPNANHTLAALRCGSLAARVRLRAGPTCLCVRALCNGRHARAIRHAHCVADAGADEPESAPRCAKLSIACNIRSSPAQRNKQ